MENFIASYGYAAVALGTFLEGETILVIAGFLAHRGYLGFPGVIAAAFVGTLAGDQLFFLLGRRGGPPALAKHPKWEGRVDRVRRLLRAHEAAVILGFRFLYGFRTVTPFLLGASGVSPLRFVPLNAAGAAIWALGIGGLGYLLGQTLEILLVDLKRFEVAILGVIAAAGAVLWFVPRWRARQ
jgi:membrane protein DedA with SNARE-associated domain